MATKGTVRVQFQDSQKGKTQNTHALAITAKTEAGVTVADVELATKRLLSTLGKVKAWPKKTHAEWKRAAQKLTKRVRQLPPDGTFKQGANVLRIRFSVDDVDYRLDLENLRGHNLRS